MLIIISERYSFLLSNYYMFLTFFIFYIQITKYEDYIIGSMELNT